MILEGLTLGLDEEDKSTRRLRMRFGGQEKHGSQEEENSKKERMVHRVRYHRAIM